VFDTFPIQNGMTKGDGFENMPLTKSRNTKTFIYTYIYMTLHCCVPLPNIRQRHTIVHSHQISQMVNVGETFPSCKCGFTGC
jgi:hypothetical protein